LIIIVTVIINLILQLYQTVQKNLTWMKTRAEDESLLVRLKPLIAFQLSREPSSAQKERKERSKQTQETEKTMILQMNEKLRPKTAFIQ
jgi:hypothetical protein